MSNTLNELTVKHFQVKGSDVYLNTQGKSGMLMIFWNNCGHCVTFKPIYRQLITYMNDSFPCVSIEAAELEKNPQLKKALNFPGYPTIKNIDHTGKITGNYEGNRNLDDILTFICTTQNYCPLRT